MCKAFNLKEAVPSHRTMLDSLPTELVSHVADYCLEAEQASLSRACSRLHNICNQILYKGNARSGASCVYHAIVRCYNQEVSIAILRKAHDAGCTFERCQSPSGPGVHVFSFPPLYLAATKGLEDLVIFLIDSGAPLDGPAGHKTTTLLGALFARKERIAMLLVRCGASLYAEELCISALHAAVCAGLGSVVIHLVRDKGMDVNMRTRSGATAVMLAASRRDQWMVGILVGLGARLYEALLYACHGNYFSIALQLLDDTHHLGEPRLSRKEAWDIARMAGCNPTSTAATTLFRRLVYIAESE